MTPLTLWHRLLGPNLDAVRVDAVQGRTASRTQRIVLLLHPSQVAWRCARHEQRAGVLWATGLWLLTLFT